MFDRTASTTLILLLGGAAMLAALNLGLAPSSPLHVPSYVVGLIGKYLCFAILALAIDLVWGFAGILSLGHARVFRARWLRNGHVPDAPNRDPRRLRQPAVA